MKEIITKSGFAVMADERLTDDWEVLELVAAASDNDPAAVIRLVNRLLGSDGAAALKEHVRGADGIVRTTDMTRELAEIFSAIAGKKSAP